MNGTQFLLIHSAADYLRPSECWVTFNHLILVS